MEIKDYVLILSALLVAVGWFVNSWLNRRNELKRTKLDFRMKLYFEVLETFFTIRNHFVHNREKPLSPNDTDKLRDLLTKIDIFGNDKEKKMANNIFESMKNGTSISKDFDELLKATSARIKSELDM